MFNIGDRIVYNENYIFYTSLKNFSVYTIDEIFDEYTHNNKNIQLFTFFEMPDGCIFCSIFFISLTEHRKNKILQLNLCSEQEKK